MAYFAKYQIYLIRHLGRLIVILFVKKVRKLTN